MPTSGPRENFKEKKKQKDKNGWKNARKKAKILKSNILKNHQKFEWKIYQEMNLRNWNKKKNQVGTRVLRDKTRSMATKENTIPWNAAIGIRFCIPKYQGHNYAINLFKFAQSSSQ